MGIRMAFENWGPLKHGDDVVEEVIAATKPRQIKNILKSYVGMYDAFSELLQK